MTATDTTTFSLRALIEDVWETEQLEDVADLTRKVLAAIPAEHHEQVLFDVMQKRVKAVLTNIRHSNNRRPAARVTPGPADDAPTPGRSRWLDTAGLYRRFLTQPESVGENKVKPLGDLVRDEVLAAAERRMANAKANAALAKRYERIADAMQREGVEIVGDLSQPALMEVFQ